MPTSSASTGASVETQFHDLVVEGVRIRLAAFIREGTRVPLLLLHGFGSTKEDFADLALLPQFRDRTIIAYDAPGFGETQCSDHRTLSIPFLQKTAERLIAIHGFERFHLLGHSMGGLTGLLLAYHNPNTFLSFTNIEGNLASEDCFLSRQIYEYPSNDAAGFLTSFVERMRRAPSYSNALYAAGLPCKVRPESIAPIFRSMVDLSDNGALLEKIVALPFPVMFVHGSENRSLSYLSTLRSHGVQVAEIPNSGHFPMYANPQTLWWRLVAFVVQSEA